MPFFHLQLVGMTVIFFFNVTLKDDSSAEIIWLSAAVLHAALVKWEDLPCFGLFNLPLVSVL